MTTSQSPRRVLKAQADSIAKMLKAVERGEKVPNDPAGKIAASLALGVVKVGIVQDDKVIMIEMPWSTVRERSEVSLSEWIVTYMSGERAQ
jgi:hypothetical protein